MLIERFDPQADASKLRACFDMTRAGWPIDHPGQPGWAYDSFAGKWARGFDPAPLQAWLVTNEAGIAVGCYLLRLPDKENPTMATCIVAVDPARRRAGIGTEIIAHCSEQARRAGRSRLISYTRDDSPGAAFAAALGARPGIAEVDRVLEIDAALAARVPDLRGAARPHAAGYSLASWIGPTPDEYVDDVVLVNAAIADAPRDEGVEPTGWDAERLRHSEQTMLKHGLTGYVVAARHDATGRLAALTAVITEAETPDWGFQQLTAVLPQHRGHRLGLLLKIAMLDFLAEHDPRIRHIQTGNAGANEHMIAINEQLGYTVLSVYRAWELDLVQS
ncbi:MAG TPA: GNAT family N-acetyltransferase [Streptosporangiaceae bacterium]|nr:GNAT family N-acetyltransferase [Streptosporangiaceae bacterium]